MQGQGIKDVCNDSAKHSLNLRH